jgi:hypothetical protein
MFNLTTEDSGVERAVMCQKGKIVLCFLTKYIFIIIILIVKRAKDSSFMWQMSICIETVTIYQNKNVFE